MVRAPHRQGETLQEGSCHQDVVQRQPDATWPPEKDVACCMVPTTHWPLPMKPLAPPPQPKESRSVPARAGDGPRHGGEARVGRLAPDIAVSNDSDGVP